MNTAATFLLAQQDGQGGGIIAMLISVVYLAVIVAVIAGMWKMFEKAGQPGWAALIPIYNGIVLLQIVGRPIWWIVLFFIPCVGIVFAILVSIDLAKSFGKDVVYGIGIALLGFVFIPLLGFGDARYVGPAAGR